MRREYDRTCSLLDVKRPEGARYGDMCLIICYIILCEFVTTVLYIVPDVSLLYEVMLINCSKL